MLVAQSKFETQKAVAYLKKFCRHFAHKLPTEFDDNNGQIEFPFGNCKVETLGNQLQFTVEAETEELIAKMEDVVARHMERFAFRDEIKMTWERQ